MGLFNAWKERAARFRVAVEAAVAELALSPDMFWRWTVEVVIHDGRVEPKVWTGALPLGARPFLEKFRGLVQELVDGSALRFGRIEVVIQLGRLRQVRVTTLIRPDEDDRLGRLLDPGGDDE